MATFIFSGDPNAPKTNPETCELFGMTFPLGEKVKVDDEGIAERLRRHSHFTEAEDDLPTVNQLDDGYVMLTAEKEKPRRGRPPKVRDDA